MLSTYQHGSKTFINFIICQLSLLPFHFLKEYAIFFQASTSYQHRKALGKIKFIKDLSPDSQEMRREKNRIHVANFRKRQRQYLMKRNVHEEIDKNLSKSMAVKDVSKQIINKKSVEVVSRQKLTAQKKIKKDNIALRRENQQLQLENNALKKKVSSLNRKVGRQNEKIHRLTEPPATIEAEDLLKGCTVSQEVKNTVVAHFALKKQLSNAYTTFETNKEKQFLSEVVAGEGSEVRKCKTLQDCREFLVKKNKNIVNGARKSQSETLKKHVQEFLESDESSRQAPGKKDCITIKKEKIQKRYLNASLKELHHRFVEEKKIDIGFTTFCKYRPRHIVKQKVNMRDTCACVIHENMDILVAQCNKLGMTQSKTAESMAYAQCCFPSTESCLARTCALCSNKTVDLNTENIDINQPCTIVQWKSKKEERISAKTNQKIIVQLTVKEENQGTISDICSLLKTKMVEFMIHLNRIRHQYKSVKKLKENLAPNEIIVHVDFAENYNCKYAKEVQSVHFGASRAQITLHTGVLYSHGRSPQCFCTLSESTNHGPTGIFAHLEEILEPFLLENPHVDSVHFQSDGPSTQYKNKKMFGIITVSLPKRYPQIKKITWNYSERYHGKGAPDGVGGLMKRTLDDLVACGLDIHCFDSVQKQLTERVTSVITKVVTAKAISDAETYCFHNEKTFQGTKQMLQVTWAVDQGSRTAQFNKMSCFDCAPGAKCSHYHLGTMVFPQEPTKEKALSDPIVPSLKLSIPLDRLGLTRQMSEVKVGSSVFMEENGAHIQGILFTYQ